MISLYGDSYVDDYVVDASVHPWTKQLGDVHNYGQCGTGIDYSLESLRRNHGNPIVFILGNADRLLLHDIPHKHSVDISNHFYFNLNHATPIDDYIKDNYDHLSYMYNHLNHYIKHRSEEALAYLSYYASLHDTTLIVIPTTPLATDLPRRLNHYYFHIYPYNLASVSRHEYIDASHTHGHTDHRQNHLSQINHDILASNITRMLDGHIALPHEQHFLDDSSPGHYIYE